MVRLCIYFIKLGLLLLFVLIKILELLINVFKECLFMVVNLEFILSLIFCILILIVIWCYILLCKVEFLISVWGFVFLFLNIILILILLEFSEMKILVLLVFVIFWNSKIFLELYVWNLKLYLVVLFLWVVIFIKDLGFGNVKGLYFLGGVL